MTERSGHLPDCSQQVLYQCHDIIVIADYLQDLNWELQFRRTLWGAVRDSYNEDDPGLLSQKSREESEGDDQYLEKTYRPVK